MSGNSCGDGGFLNNLFNGNTMDAFLLFLILILLILGLS